MLDFPKGGVFIPHFPLDFGVTQDHSRTAFFRCQNKNFSAKRKDFGVLHKNMMIFYRPGPQQRSALVRFSGLPFALEVAEMTFRQRLASDCSGT